MLEHYTSPFDATVVERVACAGMCAWQDQYGRVSMARRTKILFRSREKPWDHRRFRAFFGRFRGRRGGAPDTCRHRTDTGGSIANRLPSPA